MNLFVQEDHFTLLLISYMETTCADNSVQLMHNLNSILILCTLCAYTLRSYNQSLLSSTMQSNSHAYSIGKHYNLSGVITSLSTQEWPEFSVLGNVYMEASPNSQLPFLAFYFYTGNALTLFLVHQWAMLLPGRELTQAEGPAFGPELVLEAHSTLDTKMHANSSLPKVIMATSNKSCL